MSEMGETAVVPAQFARAGAASAPGGVAPFIAFRPLPPAHEAQRCRARLPRPRCAACKAYMSPFAGISEEGRFWRCPLCGAKSPLPADPRARPETRALVCDIAAGRGAARAFAVVVDENLLVSGSRARERMLECARAVERAVGPRDRLCCVIFGAAIAVVDFARARMEAFVGCGTECCRAGDGAFGVGRAGAAAVVRALADARVAGERGAAPLTACAWACELLGRCGGRVVLFSSGRCDECDGGALARRVAAGAVSLSVFRSAPVHALEACAAASGGAARPFGPVEPVAALFAAATAWGASSALRVSRGFEVAGVLGPCARAESGVASFPVLTGEQAVIYEIRENGEERVGSEFFFQLAFRFTDDEGLVWTRIVNGRMPCTSVIQFPVDEAALALYMLRKRNYEVAEKGFFERIGALKEKMPSALRKMPVLLYNGRLMSRSFIGSTCVERFEMSIFPFDMEVEKRKFEVLFSSDAVIVFPEPNGKEKESIVKMIRDLGFAELAFYSPANEVEFQDMFIACSEKESVEWYSSISS